MGDGYQQASSVSSAIQHTSFDDATLRVMEVLELSMLHEWYG